MPPRRCLRRNSALPVSTSNPAGLIGSIDPTANDGPSSDHSNGGATYGTFNHVHRFQGGGLLKTAVRHGTYDRDRRSGVIRFANPAPGNAGRMVFLSMTTRF